MIISNRVSDTERHVGKLLLVIVNVAPGLFVEGQVKFRFGVYLFIIVMIVLQTYSVELVLFFGIVIVLLIVFVFEVVDL